jgi:ATP/maltotriose-dependent transcriptional regulator MalT
LALFLLAQVIERQGDLATARSYVEESQTIWRELRDERNLAFTFTVLGRIALAQGDHIRASSLCTEGLHIALRVQDKWCIGCFLGSFVGLAASQQQSERALCLAAATDAVFQMIGTPLPLATGKLVERSRAKAMQAVDVHTLARAQAQGQAMTLEQAVAYALEPLPEETPVARPVTPERTTPTSAYPAGLSAREVEVLRLIAQGLTNAQVAERLVVSAHTVHTHLRTIYGKLDVTSRAAATRFAVEHHLV